MKLLLACLLVLSSVSSLRAQTPNAAFPATALAAKTVIILNETHAAPVEDGASSTLKTWGHLRVVDTLEEADIVLRFSKEPEQTRTNSQKTGSDGKPSEYGFSISFDRKIHMTATTRDGFAAFYSTETSESKQKAGQACAMSFIDAWQDAARRAGTGK